MTTHISMMTLQPAYVWSKQSTGVYICMHTVLTYKPIYNHVVCLSSFAGEVHPGWRRACRLCRPAAGIPVSPGNLVCY